MEILQDTIIKLIIRQGSNTERKAVVLTSGEQGYTTDTNRVYVGDGTTFGGNVVGNLYKQDVSGLGVIPITFASEIGDLIFNTTTRKLYRSVNPGIANLTGWSEIGGVYISGDNKINISSSNVITLCALSGGAFAPEAVLWPITLSASKIALPPLSAYTVSSDLLQYPITLSGGKISLPPLSAYTISENLLLSPLVLSAGKIALLPLSGGGLSNDSVEVPIYLNNGKVSLLPLSAGYVSSDLLRAPIVLSAGKISLPPLSANTISPNAVEAPIIINNGKIALSAKIPIDRVSTNIVSWGDGFDITDLTTFLSIPNFTEFSLLSTSVSINYIPPVSLVLAALSANLDGPVVYNIGTGRIGLSAQLPFQRVSTNTITASSGLQAYVNGVDVGVTPINPLSANIVLQSNQLLLRFQGATGTNTYSKGISGIRVGLGQYLFRYGPLPTANIYPFIQIHSLNSHRFTARTMSVTVSSLSVTIVEGDVANPTTFGDVELFLQLNY